MAAIDEEEDTLPTNDTAALEELRRLGSMDHFRVASWAGRTSVGHVREQNEDRWHADGETVFAVADGMGGHAGGEVAAQAVVDALSTGDGPPNGEGIDALIGRLNEAVLDAGRRAGVTGLGSTLVMLSLKGRTAMVAGVGDSRVYRLRDGQLEQLTHDHTVRNEFLQAGVPLDASNERGVPLDALTSYLGVPTGRVPAISSASHSLLTGDRFLLCTDGIHGQLTSNEIAGALDLEACDDSAAALISRADLRGGRDNATAVVVDVGTRELHP
ncbi:MAG: PP2C family serine/threonine-protein phosphatase [Acidimicrobiales bacterium]|nr:PP2C family serine/threonine-protein phosphatase [Acidimicrobiales bacterium]